MDVVKRGGVQHRHGALGRYFSAEELLAEGILCFLSTHIEVIVSM